MGSISRFNRIEDFIEAFKEKAENHFSRLVGLEVKELKDVEVSYHVKGRVLLSNGEILPVHFRWSDPEEDAEGKELDEDFVKMKDYYQTAILGKTIQSIRLGHADRDDEVYLLAYVDKENCIEIPFGFDPENMVIYGFAEEIISSEEFDSFVNNR